MKPAIFDTHCHLDALPFNSTSDECVANAKKVGVQYLLVPSVGGQINFEQLLLLQQCFGVLVAFGFHPLYADRYTDNDLSLLADYLQTKKPIAIGEIGLDCWQGMPDMSYQQTLFEKQLKLAQQYNKPIILHVRRAVDLLIQTLRKIPVVGGIVHAFNGSQQQAHQLIELGFKLGFGGTLTYPNADHIRDLVATLPNESLVLETDAPYMPPAWSNNKQSQLTDIAQYAEVMATLREQTSQEIIQICTENAFQALQLQRQETPVLHQA